MTQPAPPGWYRDPSGAPAMRWWDGVSWGQHTQPMPMLPAPVFIQAPRHVGGLTYGGHLMHGLATLFTCGLWAPIWIICAMAGRRRIG